MISKREEEGGTEQNKGRMGRRDKDEKKFVEGGEELNDNKKKKMN